MKSDTGTANSLVEALECQNFDLAELYMLELAELHGPKRVKLLLAAAGAPLAYLKLASHAASQGDQEAVTRFYKCACRYASEDEVIALKEIHRFSFTAQHQPEATESKNRLGFALV